MLPARILIVMVLLFLSTFMKSSQGDIVFDTLGSNRAAGPTVGASSYQQGPNVVNSSAFQFANSSNTDYILTSASILTRNGFYPVDRPGFLATIESDNQNQPGTAIGQLVFPDTSTNVNTSSVFTATSSGGILLQRNTKYWIYFSPIYGTTDSNYSFVQNNQNIGGLSYGYYGTRQNPFQTSNGPYDNYTAAFQISGVVGSAGALVPEPSSLLLFLSGSSLTFIGSLRLRRRTSSIASESNP